jgi:hypothetical protein
MTSAMGYVIRGQGQLEQEYQVQEAVEQSKEP